MKGQGNLGGYTHADDMSETGFHARMLYNSYHTSHYSAEYIRYADMHQQQEVIGKEYMYKRKGWWEGLIYPTRMDNVGLLGQDSSSVGPAQVR